MEKITLHNNLVPCRRPIDGIDLTANLHIARQLIATAKRMFWIRNDVACYSGYFNEAGDVFSIQIWERDSLYRTYEIQGAGFSGVLFVEVTRAEAALTADPILAFRGLKAVVQAAVAP